MNNKKIHKPDEEASSFSSGVVLGPPDIFRAARNNDIDEFKIALDAGQTFTFVSPLYGTTAFHVAVINGSMAIIENALKIDPQAVWVKDHAGNTPADVARIVGEYGAITSLIEVMYGSLDEPIPVK